MTFANEHVVLQWGGAMPGPEIWSNSLRMNKINPSADPLPSQADLNTALQGSFSTALTNFWLAIDNFVGTATTLKFFKANRVGVDGKYIDPTTNEKNMGGLTGQGGTNRQNQLGQVVTWTTAIARGRASKGRIFTPCNLFVIDATTGQIPIADAQTIANAAKAFITALNTAAAPLLLEAAVMSNVGTGVSQEITGTKVGRVTDTQRRRRNKAIEAPVVGV